jgi:PAS domain S-box-containing protein
MTPVRTNGQRPDRLDQRGRWSTAARSWLALKLRAWWPVLALAALSIVANYLVLPWYGYIADGLWAIVILAAAVRLPLREAFPCWLAVLALQILAPPLPNPPQWIRSVGVMVVASLIIRQRNTLRATEGRYRDLVEHSADAVVGTTLDGTITSWNPAAERLYGYSAAEIAGQSLTRLIPPERSEELPGAILARLERGERIEQLETVRLHRDGSPVEVALSISPIRDSRGELVGTSSIAHDIGARLALQRLQDEFLALAAHELRNPLTALSAYVELLERRPSRDGRELRGIVRQTARLRRLIDDLVDVARLERGHLALQRERLDLVELVQTSVAAAQAANPSHPIRLDLPTGPLAGCWDRDRIAQVLDNLLGNAAKYSPAESEIVVQVADQGQQVQVTVADRGSGIPPASLPRLFERFYRVQSPGTGGVGGLGLGLYVSKSLVEAHGGTIWVESAAGQGSTFGFTLPAAATPSS